MAVDDEFLLRFFRLLILEKSRCCFLGGLGERVESRIELAELLDDSFDLLSMHPCVTGFSFSTAFKSIDEELLS